MKKVLVHAGYAPFDNPTAFEILTYEKSNGGNPGNMMFTDAIYKVFMDAETSFDITNYKIKTDANYISMLNSTYSCFVMPLADAFREDNIENLIALSEFVRKLKIPCYVIGVGLRESYNHNNVNNSILDKAVIKFVSAVLEKSSIIGVRGYRTGEYLRRLGFKEDIDYMVIGCPSLSVFGRQIDSRNISLESKKICFIANTLCSKELKSLYVDLLYKYTNNEFVVQKEFEEKHIFLGHFANIEYTHNLPENVIGEILYKDLYKNDKLRFFTSSHEWIRYCRDKYCFCITMRFHGGVAALSAGVPILLFPIDSRMYELTTYHGIPFVDYNNVNEHQITVDDVENMIKSLDYSEFNTKLNINRNRFISFLKMNGIDSYNLERGDNSTYDRVSSNISWNESPNNFANIVMRERISRVCGYYSYKISRRLMNK